MTTLSHTATTPYDGRAVTVTVTGLPEQAAQAVADYTDQLTHELEARRLTQKGARRQAYRIVEKSSRPSREGLSEEKRLELARRGEKAARPAEAEIRIAELTAGGGAYLRLYDHEGGARTSTCSTSPSTPPQAARPGMCRSRSRSIKAP